MHPENRYEALQVIFDQCIDTATMYTNTQGRRIAHQSNISWKACDVAEMKAFLGLHLIAGAFKAGHRKQEELWNDRDEQ